MTREGDKVAAVYMQYMTAHPLISTATVLHMYIAIDGSAFEVSF